MNALYIVTVGIAGGWLMFDYVTNALGGWRDLALAAILVVRCIVDCASVQEQP